MFFSIKLLGIFWKIYFNIKCPDADHGWSTWGVALPVERKYKSTLKEVCWLINNNIIIRLYLFPHSQFLHIQYTFLLPSIAESHKKGQS